MNRMVIPLLLAACLTCPGSALAADGGGGTAVPTSPNGGVRSIPGDPPAPAPVAPATPKGRTPTAGRAVTGAAPGAPSRSTAAPRTSTPSGGPVAQASQSDDTVEVPVPRPRSRSRAPAPAVPQAATAVGLPTTGFDLGGVVALGMLMLGVGVLLCAVVGPRHRPGL